MSAVEVVEVVHAVETVLIADLRIDADIQCRAAGISKRVVGEYAAAMKAGSLFPPVVAFLDSKGSKIVAEGFHRVAACELAGLTEISCEVRQGSRKDALLFAAQANSQHGLRRTTADKRRAIELLIGTFPKMSDRKIGEACGVDNKTVAATRARLTKSTEEIPHPETEQAASPDPETVIVTKLLARVAKLAAQVPEAKRLEFIAAVTGMLEAKPADR